MENSHGNKVPNVNHSLHSGIDKTLTFLTQNYMLVNVRPLNTRTVENLLKILFVDEK